MPKLVEKDLKRSEFVVASLAVIARAGLNAATLRRISAEVGCTTGSITHYFAGRDALLVEILRTVHYAAGARMLAVAREAASDAARLEGVLLESLPLDPVRMREWKVWLAFWSAAPVEPRLAGENARRYAEWRGMLETVLGPFCADAEATRREASLLMALVDGLGVRLALLPQDDAALGAKQQAAAADLRQYLKKFTGPGA
jgi:AcrR family transcriptional regulator